MGKRVNPKITETYINLGDALLREDKTQEAACIFEKASSLEPDNPEIYLKWGVAFGRDHHLKEAIPLFEKALAIRPDYPEAQVYWGLLQLLQGNLQAGWPAYNWRFVFDDYKGKLPYNRALWEGESLNGKTLLVLGEEGFGDQIQFFRYLPLIQKKYDCHIIFVTDPVLITLFQQCQGVDELIETLHPDIQYDYFIPIMSLAKVFNTSLETIPANIPYITPDPDLVSLWKKRMNKKARLQIGLVWAGSPKNPNNRYRSCRFSDFSVLATLNDVHFYSLQMGPESEQADILPVGMPLTRCDKNIRDFSDTAAIIQNLDLIITVDTSMAHLAGALGIPVWVLLSVRSDWRWLLEREDSPWYPSMKLFRPTTPHNWDNVMQLVLQTLIHQL